MSFLYISSLIYSQLVVVNAYLIRLFLIWLAKNIRFKNLTKETNWIMLTIFYMNLFTYGLVYLLAPWDSSDSNIPIVRDFFGGLYKDINAFWFNDVGVLIMATMVFNAFYPAIEFFMYWGLRLLFRCMDQSTCCPRDRTKTKSKTMQGFVEIYQGPLFEIHWKYAYLLNVVYVTMIFGPGMPILFPLALLSLVCLYVSERLMVAYSYIKPPMFDGTVNRTTLNLLYFAPILYAISAAATFSNQQVFKNSVVPRINAEFYPPTNHQFIADSFSQITPATPFFILVVLLVLTTLYRYTRSWIQGKYYREESLEEQIKDMVPVQNLDSFFRVLKDKVIENWVKEEVVCKERCDMQRLKESSFKELIQARETKGERKGNPKLQGVHNYDILSNPMYAERYLYTPCRYPNRSSYVISQYTDKELRKLSNDLIRTICDLPYLTTKKARELEFSAEYLYSEKLARVKDEQTADQEKFLGGIFDATLEKIKTTKINEE